MFRYNYLDEEIDAYFAETSHARALATCDGWRGHARGARVASSGVSTA